MEESTHCHPSTELSYGLRSLTKDENILEMIITRSYAKHTNIYVVKDGDSESVGEEMEEYIARIDMHGLLVIMIIQSQSDSLIDDLHCLHDSVDDSNEALLQS